MSIQYENRQAPEGVNVTRHNPVLHLLKLLAAAVVFIVVLVIVLNLLGAKIARTVPFEVETALMDRVDHSFSDPGTPPGLQAYLYELSERVGENLQIPEEMEMQVHYDSENEFNAYATLGGNVVFYRGLLKSMPHENALAMVVAHELAHVIHRDPIAGLGGGMSSMLAVAALTGTAGGGAVAKVLTTTGTITQLSFSREMESAADRAALVAIQKTYGHIAGADELFKVLQIEKEREGESWTAGFSSTHPQDASRIEAIARMAKENEWPTTGPLTPLPDEFTEWLGGAGQ